MAQSSVLKCKGLYTFPNALSELPEGALTDAQNVVIDRDGVITPRRGFKLFGNAMPQTGAVAKQLLVYKGAVIRHWGSTLEYDTTGTGTFVPFSVSFTGNIAATVASITNVSSTMGLKPGMLVVATGIPAGTTVTVVNTATGTLTLSAAATATTTALSIVCQNSITEVATGLRIKGIEANGNFYITTSQGIQKISSSSVLGVNSPVISNAGGIKALDGTATLNPSVGQFFNQESVVSYRIVWGIQDVNTNLILGVPSESIVIYNPLLPLLITDFNNLIVNIDTTAAASGADHLGSSGFKFSSLKLGNNVSASTVYSSLQTLAQKLDIDLTEQTYYGLSGNVQSISAANPSIIQTSAAHGLTTGQKVIVSGSNCIPSIDGTWTITVTDTTHFQIQASVTTAGTATGTWKTTSIANNHPTAPSLTPSTQELLNIQQFYNDIVNALNLDTNIGTGLANFQNATTTGNVTLSFTIPQGVTTSHFYQIYRTAQATSSGVTILQTLSPGDECQLVYEANPSASDLIAQSITITDITPESFRGANLYTNPNSGLGIAQANEVPPLAQDITTWKGTTFFANTQTKQRLTVNLLAATGLTGQTFTTTCNGSPQVYTFVASVAQQVNAVCIAGNLFTASGTGDYFDIYSANNAKHYRFWFSVGTATAPAGGAGITVSSIAVVTTDTASQVATKVSNAINAISDFVTSISSATVTITNQSYGYTNAPSENVANAGFTVSTLTSGSGENAASNQVGISNAGTPAQAVDETARSLARVVNKNPSEVVYAFYISGTSDVPGAILFEARNLGTAAIAFTASTTTVGGKFSPTLPTSGTTVITTNEVRPNRIFYSQYQQPEAVPLVNYIDIGAKDKAILRTIPLRDSLFICKQDGIFRLSGEAGNFAVTLFDSSTLMLAPDTGAVLNNLIYMVSTQGVATVSETGVSVISRPIENLVLNVTSAQYVNFSTASFAVGYESDRAYYLWTVANTADTFATVCYRFNTFTNTWTQLNLAKTCAVVNPVDFKLYLGASDTNYIEQERKDFARTDIADRETTVTIPIFGVNNTTLSLGSLFGIGIGDVIVQTQYLTISQYNRILRMLDSDPGVTGGTYYANNSANAGDNLADRLITLCAQLNADPKITVHTYTASASTNQITWQTMFNGIVNQLNNDSNVSFTTYPLSSGTTQYETTVVAVDSASLKISTSIPAPFVAATATVYKAITSSITWAPNTLGDASMMKLVRESTILFETKAITSGQASYASDMSPGFTAIAFQGEGTGTWGGLNWGSMTYGGFGTSAPFRTYIPLEKSRCRFIKAKYDHGAAFEQYAIFGVSFTFETLSSRAWR